VLKSGVRVATAFGKYAECRKCGSRVKILSMQFTNGSHKEIVIGLGETAIVSGKEMKFTKEEEANVWKD
jgi:hypothetical protein